MKTRLSVYNTMLETGLVPVFYMDTPDAAQTFVSACMAGGVNVVEFTNRGHMALPVFQHLRNTFPDLVLGIGSIVDAPTAALYIGHGADFIVGPNFDADIAHVCNARKLAYIPGCSTLTEIHRAEQLGAEIVKLFPASIYGPAFIKSVQGPCPWTRIMPTGGVDITEDSIRTWFEAGASCVGIGSNLTKVPNIAEQCQQILKWIQVYRRELL